MVGHAASARGSLARTSSIPPFLPTLRERWAFSSTHFLHERVSSTLPGRIRAGIRARRHDAPPLVLAAGVTVSGWYVGPTISGGLTGNRWQC